MVTPHVKFIRVRQRKLSSLVLCSIPATVYQGQQSAFDTTAGVRAILLPIIAIIVMFAIIIAITIQFSINIAITVHFAISIAITVHFAISIAIIVHFAICIAIQAGAPNKADMSMAGWLIRPVIPVCHEFYTFMIFLRLLR